MHQYYMRRDARRQFIRRKERLQLQHPDSVLSAMRRGTAPCSSTCSSIKSSQRLRLGACRALGPLPATARGDTRTRGRRPNMQGPSRNPHGRTLSVLEDCMGSTFGWWRRRCCADTGDGPTAARRSLRPRGVTLACYAWAPPHVCVKPSRTNLILDVLAGASKYGVELEDERHARRCTR